MAKLNPKLIFAMTRELNELNQIGQEMIKRIGHCQLISWRYPDQLIKDVIIEVNVEFYNTQEKYILLTELIIDRLYLIVNMAIVFLNNLLDNNNNKKIFELPKNISRPLGISLGTVLSLFWRRLDALTLVVSARSKDSHSKNNSKIQISDQTSTYCSLLSTHKKIKAKSCDNCPASLSLIKKMINNVMDCMTKMGYESKTLVYKKNIQKSIIKSEQTAVLSEWSEALFSDIKNLTKNSISISSENVFLTRDLNEQKDENENNVKQIRILQKKYNEMERQKEKVESHLKSLSEKYDELQLKYNNVYVDFKQAEQLSNQKEESLISLEETYRTAVQEYGERLMSIQSAVKEKQEEFDSEKAYWTNLYNQIKNQMEELEKNIIEEQEKHENELKELEEKFNVDKTELEKKNLQLQTQKKTLSDQIYQLEMQEYTYIEKIKKLEERKQRLKYDIKKYQEKETLLTRCPDLNGPIVSQDTQNPIEDMKAQISANECRMKLLHEQTHNLKKLVCKMQNMTNKNQQK